MAESSELGTRKVVDLVANTRTNTERKVELLPRIKDDAETLAQQQKFESYCSTRNGGGGSFVAACNMEVR
eukprot:6198871-Alexandrium_andersonii.AAC.1